MQSAELEHVEAGAARANPARLAGLACQVGGNRCALTRRLRHSGMGFLGAIAALAGSVPGQAERFEVLLRDGSVVAGKSLAGNTAGGFEVEGAAGKQRVAGVDVLAIFGEACAESPLPAAHLAGGDVVFGEIAGGDSAGNLVELQSPVLGRVKVAVDRLTALASPGMTMPHRLILPAGVSEALFVRAAVGFDTVAGTLHQFGENGVRFQPDGVDAPRWFPRSDFVALRLAAAADRAKPATAHLLTRAGDRLGIDLERCQADGLQCRLEDGSSVTVRTQDVAGVVFAHDVVHLSDLPTTAIEETGFDGDAVHPMRRDRNALGRALVAAGHSYVKGLGVHAKSRIVFTVPADCGRFWTRVAHDDSVAALQLVPRAAVRVLVGDKVVFEHKELLAGQPPRTTGLLPVRPGDKVTLEVDFGRGRDLGDRVDWLSPVFLPAARRP